MPEGRIRFFNQVNCGGYWEDLTGNWPDLRKLKNDKLGNWNDEIQSVKIYSGRWRFFEHVGFKGASTTLEHFGPEPLVLNNHPEMKINGWDGISSIEINPPVRLMKSKKTGKKSTKKISKKKKAKKKTTKKKKRKNK
jgi:hypothetical protein